MAKPVARRADLRALGPGLVLLLGLFAYRPLLAGAMGLPAGSEVERFFFTPEETSPLLALAVAGWLLWRRRARLAALPDRRAPVPAALLLALGTALFAWARLTQGDSLLLPSLAANLLAFAAASKGGPGLRAACLPALVLLLGVPIPAPLRDELVWRLQLWTAEGGARLLRAAGYDVALHGVQLQSGEYTFTVIEACSGLRGIEILVLVALAVRELFARAGRRSWLVLPLAPPLGFALNLVRVAAVVALTAGADPEAIAREGQDHTPQGVAVLVAGTALLYAAGRALAGSRGSGGSLDEPRAPRPERRISRRMLRAAAAWLAALGAVSLLAPSFPSAPRPPPPELPTRRAGWTGEDLALDRAFHGPLRGGEVLHRRYAREPRGGLSQVVDLLVGYEVAENPWSRFFSPKLVLPAHDWSLVETRPARIWRLGLDAELAVAARDSERALVYVWRLRDGGVLRETLRAALRLEFGPSRREPRRALVRLATPLVQDGPVARDLARRTLDRFISDFRDELADL